MPRWSAYEPPEASAAARTTFWPTPANCDGHNAWMDQTQTKIIELLREVHLLALQEVERLNLRIAELEIQNGHEADKTIVKPVPEPRPAVTPPAKIPCNRPDTPDILNEHQVADYLNISVASVRRWRLFHKGPKFLKIGAAVRYRRRDLETWLDACLLPPDLTLPPLRGCK